MLGNVYGLGQGVEKNFAETIDWYLKAAKLGNDQAQYWLGRFLYSGEHVEKNPAEAVKWFCLSAEQGNDDSQVMLGVAYAEGNGVVTDPQAACAWLLLAGIRGTNAALEIEAHIHKLLTPFQTEAVHAWVDRKVAAGPRDRETSPCR